MTVMMATDFGGKGEAAAEENLPQAWQRYCEAVDEACAAQDDAEGARSTATGRELARRAEAAWDEAMRLERHIAQTRALTLAGLAVQARLLAEHVGAGGAGDALDAVLARNLAASLNWLADSTRRPC